MKMRHVIYKMLLLVKPLVFPMLVAIVLGVLGFICAIGIPIISSMALLQTVGMTVHIPMSHLFIVLLMMAILRGVLHYGEQALNHYIAFRLLAIIRDHVYTALRRLAPAKLDGKDKGNLISLITNDIELLEVFYAHTISPVCIAVIMSCLLLICFVHLHWLAALIAALAYICMAVVIPSFVHHCGQHIGQDNRDQIGALSSFFLESYRGLLTLLEYRVGKLRLKQMDEKGEHIENLQRQMKNIESLQVVMSQLLISISAIVMFIVMFMVYQKGEVSVYRVILATILMLSSFGPVMALSNLANNLLSTLSSGKRVIALLEEKELISEVTSKQPTSFDDIQVENVTFAYDEETILSDVSLTCPTHQILGIAGKSGSGKSTLLKLIMRFYDPLSGQISIHQRPLPSINTQDLRHMFAYVTQDTVLFHDTIINNIKIAKLDATDEEVYEACKKASLHDFVMSLPEGYQTKLSELGASLSGGERQRIALARAFLSDGPCLLLDEPTSHLDVLNEAVILKALQSQKGKTMVLVSHRESTLKIADQVISMNQGRIS